LNRRARDDDIFSSLMGGRGGGTDRYDRGPSRKPPSPFVSNANLIMKNSVSPESGLSKQQQPYQNNDPYGSQSYDPYGAY
jgi:hypothetical protein